MHLYFTNRNVYVAMATVSKSPSKMFMIAILWDKK